jgi:hypothetical protein
MVSGRPASCGWQMRRGCRVRRELTWSWLRGEARPVHGERTRRRFVGAVGGCTAAVALAAAGALVGVTSGTVGAVSTPTCASSATKCYSILTVVKPTAPAAGSSHTYTFKIKNTAPTQKLGSVKIFAPLNAKTETAGFVITGSSAKGAKSSNTANSAVFLTLGIKPGFSATLFVTAVAPCGTVAYGWKLQVKQSNNFSGTGNTFAPEPTVATKLTGTVAGSCALKFVNPPMSTSTGTRFPVTAKFDSTPTAHVSVEVLTTSGATPPPIDTSFKGSIALSLVTPFILTPPKVLSGTTTAAVTNGVATFTAPFWINTAGFGFRLKATNPSIPSPAYSTRFSIYAQLTKCKAKSCSTAGSLTKTGKITVSESTVTAPTGGGFVGLGFGGAPVFTCNTPTFTTFFKGTYTATVDVFKSTGKATNEKATGDSWTVTYEITKSIVQRVDTSASAWQICYASTTPFSGASGPKTFTTPFVVTTSYTYYYGLLPNCSKTAVAPCILTRHKDNAGDEVITIKASGDSYVRP